MRASTFFKFVLLTALVLAITGEETAVDKGNSMAFETDVAKMLNILVNSLYTSRNIFLREIISNASDALDKIRMIYLKDAKTPKNDTGDEPTMDIRIRVDRDNRQFILSDGGIGMVKEELGSVLGSLGTSGTQKFLESMKESQDSNFIGQFGVGFYSVFLVADSVKVASKHDDSDKQYVWESTGDGNYFVYEDPRGNTLGRGTELTIHLKKDADDFLEVDKIKETIHRYSEFVHFPIFVQTSSMVPAETEEKTDPEAEGDVKDEKAEKKMVEKTSWELVNENKPIWTRDPADITEDEYNKFYKSLTKDYDDPMYYTHFTAEGEVQFKAVLFVPGRAPHNIFDTSVAQNNIRLYVSRVFITDEFKDLLPRYLNFIKGVIDSDDLPLVVSRDQLQENRILKIIKKKLVRKALQMLESIAESDRDIEEKQKGDDEENKDEEEEAPKKKVGVKTATKILYPTFWEEFGRSLRLGMIEDGTNRAKLTKLLRYTTLKSNGTLVSFDDYVDNMTDAQSSIYYLAGESTEKVKKNPVIEDAIDRDVDVVFMTDAIDEYVVAHVTDYNDKKLTNLAKEPIKLTGDDNKKAKRIAKKRSEAWEPLMIYLKELIGPKVQRVTLTKRKTSEPFVVASPQHGLSSNMERIMKAQTLGEKNGGGEAAKRVVEINYLHPLAKELLDRVKDNNEDKVAEEIALVLYETAAMQGGFEVEDPVAFGKRVGRLLRQSVDIAPDAPLLEEDVSQYDVADDEEEKDADADKESDDAKEDEVAGEGEEKKEDL